MLGLGLKSNLSYTHEIFLRRISQSESLNQLQKSADKNASVSKKRNFGKICILQCFLKLALRPTLPTAFGSVAKLALYRKMGHCNFSFFIPP